MIALVEPMQPRVDVAPQRLDLELRISLAELRFAAQARGADDASGRHVRERAIHVGDERVARILARHDRGQREAGDHLHRHVLERMRGQIRAAVRHRLLELLDEEPLAADIGQRLIERAIALRGQAEELDPARRIKRAKPITHVLGLPEGERGLAGGNDEFFGWDGHKALRIGKAPQEEPRSYDDCSSRAASGRPAEASGVSSVRGSPRAA